MGTKAGAVPKLRKALKRSAPGLAHEREFWADGAEVVVGIDEVGRGSWAGPLTIGAIVVPKDRRIYKLRDSKQLTESEREAMFDRIADWAEAWSIGHVSNDECDQLGMSAAQKLAAKRAIDGLGVDVDAVLLDGKWNFVGHPNTTMLVKGDSISASIAAASILAKVTRDRMMRAESEAYPGFDFEFNKGYPCPRHKAALKGYGPTPLHRRSWVFMDGLPWAGVRRLPPGGQTQLFQS